MPSCCQRGMSKFLTLLRDDSDKLLFTLIPGDVLDLVRYAALLKKEADDAERRWWVGRVREDAAS